MGRLLFLLVLGGVCWWGYDSWFAVDASAASGVEEGSEAGGSRGEELLSDVSRPPLQIREGQADADGVAAEAASASEGDKLGEVIAALRAGDARIRSRAFELLVKTRDPAAQARLGGAIEDLVDELGVGDAVALLGTSNAFLHTEVGVRVLPRIVEAVHAEAPERALELSTDVLEAAMNGPIEREHAVARAAVDGVYERHKHVVRRVVFDPANSARARRYEVVAGDSLGKIARRFRTAGIKVEADTLAIVNRITNPNTLRVGQKLRVPIDPIHCVAHKASYLLATYVGDSLVRVYWMAHGKPGRDTPETSFTVGEKIQNPDWHDDGRVIPFGHPENPLGRYFVKFLHDSYTGFGAHGTNEPDSIGTQASRGCLRLRPDDILEFARLVPRGAIVQIR